MIQWWHNDFFTRIPVPKGFDYTLQWDVRSDTAVCLAKILNAKFLYDVEANHCDPKIWKLSIAPKEVSSSKIGNFEDAMYTWATLIVMNCEFQVETLLIFEDNLFPFTIDSPTKV